MVIPVILYPMFLALYSGIYGLKVGHFLFGISVIFGLKINYLADRQPRYQSNKTNLLFTVSLILMILIDLYFIVGKRNKPILLVDVRIPYELLSMEINNGNLKTYDIFISDGKIKNISVHGDVSNLGVPQYDLEGRIVVPGFLNAHVHNSMDPRVLRKWLSGGVTSICDQGTTLYTPFFLTQDAFWGSNSVPNLSFSGPIITSKDGYPVIPYGFKSVEITKKSNIKKIINYLRLLGVDRIKIAYDSKYGETLSNESMVSIIKGAHDNNLTVIAHVTQVKDLEKVVDLGVDGIAHMVGEKVSIDLLNKMATNSIYWIPTLEVMDLTGGLGHANENILLYKDLGGIILFGNDAGFIEGAQIGFPQHELKNLFDTGLAEAQIAETIITSKENYCGSIGKSNEIQKDEVADLVVIDSKKLDNINSLSNVYMVIHHGRVIINNSTNSPTYFR